MSFSVLLLSKFEDWNNNLDASLFGMISFSFIRNSNWNLRPLVEIHTGLTDLWKFGKVLKSILDVFFVILFSRQKQDFQKHCKKDGKINLDFKNPDPCTSMLGGLHVFYFTSVCSCITWFISSREENNWYVKLR